MILYQLQIINKPRPGTWFRELRGPYLEYGERFYALEYQKTYLKAIDFGPGTGGGTLYRVLSDTPFVRFRDYAITEVRPRGFEILFIGVLSDKKSERFVFAHKIGYCIHVDTSGFLYRPNLAKKLPGGLPPPPDGWGGF